MHAPIEACVDRIVERGECADRNKARVLAERTNKLRANFYNFYTDRRWGHADTYDLCVDSSKLPLEQLADYVIGYVKLRLDK